MMPLAHRPYNFTAIGDADPSLDRNYVTKLTTRCTNHDGILLEIDPSPQVQNQVWASCGDGRVKGASINEVDSSFNLS
uniref:Uncharacterized protein n=1 Tax=Oryza nivara TaxID=4536 RepID=A0A0E0I8Q7_ORYNI